MNGGNSTPTTLLNFPKIPGLQAILLITDSMG